MKSKLSVLAKDRDGSAGGKNLLALICYSIPGEKELCMLVAPSKLCLSSDSSWCPREPAGTSLKSLHESCLHAHPTAAASLSDHSPFPRDQTTSAVD